MRALLVQNDLEPRTFVGNTENNAKSMTFLGKNKLYPVYLGTSHIPNQSNPFTMKRPTPKDEVPKDGEEGEGGEGEGGEGEGGEGDDGEGDDGEGDDGEGEGEGGGEGDDGEGEEVQSFEVQSFEYGHNLLMYKTDFVGLQSFVELDADSSVDLPENYLNNGRPILRELISVLDRLSSLSDGIKENGNVCIMIDLCQKQFYAVTELDYPSTVELLDTVYDDWDEFPYQAQLDEYNTLWKLKLNIKYSVHYGIVSFNTVDSTLDELDLTQIDEISDDPVVLTIRENWKTSDVFRGSCNFSVYVPLTKSIPYRHDFDVGTLQLKPQTDFYGKLNTMCLDKTEEPRCSDHNLFCKEGVVINSSSYDICVEEGSEGTPCIKHWDTGEVLDESDWECLQNLYCQRGDALADGTIPNVCVPFGNEGTQTLQHCAVVAEPEPEPECSTHINSADCDETFCVWTGTECVNR
jgi:hypothetical protein